MIFNLLSVRRGRDLHSRVKEESETKTPGNTKERGRSYPRPSVSSTWNISGVMAGPRRPPIPHLCLVFAAACSAYPPAETVNGVIGQPVTLSCSFAVPDNWRETEIQVLWFRNFTEKLVECVARDNRSTSCKQTPSSSRTRLSPSVFRGDAALEIAEGRESDAGLYQCWVIFSQSYAKVDKVLTLQGAGADTLSPGGTRVDGIPSWRVLWAWFSRNFLLISGWLLALSLICILLPLRSPLKPKNITTVSSYAPLL